MRTTLTSTIVAVGLLAGSAGSAVAGQAEPSRVNDAVLHAAAMRSLAADQLADDGPAPVRIVRVTRPPAGDSGFNWADGAIGAGVTAALLLGAAGVASSRRHPAITAR